MEWHSVNQAKKPWREQMECIVEVEGVKYMSIQRSHHHGVEPY